jgi:hypothetical protein
MIKYLKTRYIVPNDSTELFELLPLNDILIIRSQEADRVDIFTQPSGFSIGYKGNGPTSLPGQRNEETGLAEGESLGDMLIDAIEIAVGTNWREVVTVPESYNAMIQSALEQGGNWTYPGVPEEGDKAFIDSAAAQAAKKQAEDEAALKEAKKKAAEEANVE